MYIVTGGAGFIGSAFVHKLNQEGIDDIIIVDELGDSEKWKNLIGLKFKDYLHKKRYIELIESAKFKGRLTAMIHMGACSSTTETDLDFLMKNNYRYSKRLAEYSLENNIRFLYASSAATYGDASAGYSDDLALIDKLRPLNRYGYSKQLFDLWVLKKQVQDRVAGFKFFNVYGPNEYHKDDMRSVVNKAYHQIKDSGTVSLFKSYRPDYKDGEQKRDFIYIKDCLDVMWYFLDNPEHNGIFNIGSAKARSWNDLASAVFSALGAEKSIKYIDMPDHLKDQYQYFTEATIDKLKETGCPCDFMSLEDGIIDYVQNYMEKDFACM